MNLPFHVRAGAVVGLGCALLFPSIAPAADWTAAAGDLGRNATRFALHIGGSWGPVAGTEVEKVDPASGFELGASGRFWRSVSLYGSYAASTGSVSGQITQLLDQRIRPDGRSGNVDGEVAFRRFRAGLRVDGLRQENWPVQAYFVAAAVFTTNEVTLNTVDHVSPAPIPLPGGRSLDIRKFEDTQTGFLGRAGLEYFVATHVWVYANFTYEVFEPPPGTNATSSINGGLTVRI